MTGFIINSPLSPRPTSLSQPASVNLTKDQDISMERIEAKAGHSLYWTLTKWISITFIICSAIEYIASQRISNHIDSVTLQEQASEVLNDYSANLRRKWEDLKIDNLKGSNREEKLEELINSTYTSQHILPILVSGKKIITPDESELAISQKRIRSIINELVIDDDKYIINLDHRESALAAATKKIWMNDQEDIQTNLVLIMKWPVLQNLRELEREALKLKGLR
jgi:hypothetical protein